MSRHTKSPRELPGEFRPFLHGIHHDNYLEELGGDSGSDFELVTGQRLQNIKRILLYAHRCVIPDPLFYNCEYFPSEREELVFKSQIRLTNFLDFLFVIRPLVEHNIVAFYPQHEHGGAGFPINRFRSVDFEDWIRANWDQLSFAEKSDIEQDWGRELALKYGPARLESGRRTYAELFFFGQRYGAQLLCPSHIPLDVLDLMVAHGLAKVERPIATEQAQMLRTLFRTQLPSAIHYLTMEDIVSVRENDLAFSEYRRSLGAAILRIHDFESDYDPMELQRSISSFIADATEKAKAAIDQSGALSKMKEKFWEFGWGMILPLLLMPDPGLTAGFLATVGIVTGITAQAKTKQPSRDALLRHYGIWNPVS